MPELPEVETIVRDLKKEVVGKEIESVNIKRGYGNNEENKRVIRTLEGKRIEKVERVSKNIVFTLSGPKLYLAIHLALTGRLLFRRAGSLEDPHNKVTITFSEGHELRFCDMRMFGKVKILNQIGLKNLKQKVGPSPFHKDLNAITLLTILKKKKTQIKKALLDQSLISGLGNIYANDSLWMAKIHPETLTYELSESQADSLLKSMRELLTEGVSHRGSTLDDLMYVDIYGNYGEHQKHFRVYGRGGLPCLRCKTKVEVINIGGRSTFFCPKCQRKGAVKLTLAL